MHCDVHLHPDEIVGEHRCGNADIHYGNHGKLGLSASKIHGWGVFALQPFKKGEFIYQYVGEILSQNEADRRKHRRQHLPKKCRGPASSLSE